MLDDLLVTANQNAQTVAIAYQTTEPPSKERPYPHDR